MSPIKWLNYILFIENLQGIYRNYCNQSKIRKYFIILQILTQIILHSIAIITQIKLLLGGDDYGQINLIAAFSTAAAYVYSLLTVVTSICYSCGFMSYYRSIRRVSELFEGDTKFLKSHKRIFLFSLSLIFLSITFAVYRSAVALLQFSQSDLFYLVMILVSQTIIRLNIVFQHLTLFVVIMMVVNSLKSLTSLISVVQEVVRKYDTSLGDRCNVTKEQIQGWVELYRDIANCCEKVTLCFGRQIFFTLSISTSYFIILTYQISYRIVLENDDMYELKKMAFVLCFYISLMMLPIVAGQMTRNQEVKFHRVLARVYNAIIKNSREAEAKLIKDFIRLIKKNALEIKLLSNIPLGMCILPVILTLAVNFVILMLQFNHII